MKYHFLLISMVAFLNCYAQRTFIDYIRPDWEHNSREMIQSQHVKIDSAWYYTKKENNHDSTLAMVAVFDSLGNLTERKEFTRRGELLGFTQYIYADTMLLQKVKVSKSILIVNGSDLTKEVNTYDHNESGYVVTEKYYNSFGDSFKSTSVTELNRDYDSVGHLIREYIKMEGAKPYLHHDYTWSDGHLTEIKTYNIDKIWIYSYLYYYDENGNLTQVFLYNNSKSLNLEFTYDETKLVMEKDFGEGRNALDHTTQTYKYKSNGLIGSQTFETVKGEKYYYKHYYSK